MKDKNSPFLDEMLGFFIKVPVWVGPLFAGFVYVIFRYGVPQTFAELPAQFDTLASPLLAHIALISAIVAPWLALVVMMVWVVSLLHRKNRQELWNRNYTMEQLRWLTWQQFEKLVAEFYRRQEFAVEERGGSQADGGIDLVLRKAGKTTLVQCKHWKNYSVGVAPVRELLGVVHSEGAQNGILVSGGHFSEAAVQFATHNPIALVNGRALLEMIAIAKGLPIQISGPGTPSSPACPKCGGPMMEKTARKGRFAGRKFFSCAGYPRCKGIVDTGSLPPF